MTLLATAKLVAVDCNLRRGKEEKWLPLRDYNVGVLEVQLDSAIASPGACKCLSR